MTIRPKANTNDNSPEATEPKCFQGSVGIGEVISESVGKNGRHGSKEAAKETGDHETTVGGRLGSGGAVDNIRGAAGINNLGRGGCLDLSGSRNDDNRLGGGSTGDNRGVDDLSGGRGVSDNVAMVSGDGDRDTDSGDEL